MTPQPQPNAATNTASPRFTCAVCETDADRQTCMAIRVTVFVDEQNVPADLEPDEYDAVAVHLLARDAETLEPIATARIVEKPGRLAKIGRVAALAPYRGTGAGAFIMRAALDESRARGLTHAVLDAQVPVIAFYEKLGFTAEGPVFDDAGIPHRTMRRLL